MTVPLTSKDGRSDEQERLIQGYQKVPTTSVLHHVMCFIRRMRNFTVSWSQLREI